jgi:hypothetical protein
MEEDMPQIQAFYATITGKRQSQFGNAVLRF